MSRLILRVLVAAGVVGVERGALAGAGAVEVAEAVVQLRAGPQDRADGSPSGRTLRRVKRASWWTFQ